MEVDEALCSNRDEAQAITEPAASGVEGGGVLDS